MGAGLNGIVLSTGGASTGAAVVGVSGVVLETEGVPTVGMDGTVTEGMPVLVFTGGTCWAGWVG